MFCWTTVLIIRTLLNVVVSAEQDVPDSEVFCVFMDSCILPCSFQSSRDDDVIHWFQGTGRQIHVHSFYNNQDQLGLQDQNFRNRTSLFQDQISRGNCSLLLRGVKVQDEGRYEWYTNTIYGSRNSFVHLRVDAPVSEVHMSQEENRITCSSEGIY
ncbi:CD276 antigen, partial [Austrofundulus limnaeus]|uniref:CD276 antigen n=1 Tax=Austrofundulus limnaeus TaxID=52670 RepID=A0A2I4CT87_AUSLI